MEHKSVARGVLIGVIVALTIGSAVGCVRSKPERLVASHSADEGQAPTFEPSPTAQVVLPIVGGVDEAQDSSDVLFTPTATLLTSTIEPTPTATQPEPTATIVTATPEPTLAPSGDMTYTVRSGDTLLTIANKYNTTKQAIMDRNGFSNANLIRVGQILIIPVGFIPTNTPTPSVIQHVVRAGETLSSIAAKYGVTTDALVQANGLTNPNVVYVGQRLIIPS